MIMEYHVKLRFVQRILQIKDVSAAKKFIKENEYEVIYKLLNFVNHSELLINNYAPDRKDTLDYYINNETLIIIKPNKKEVVTVFDITLDINQKVNSVKIREYIKLIRKNNNKIKSLKERQKSHNKITKHLEYMSNYLSNDISETLKEKIRRDTDASIVICKEMASEEKSLRMENRELMSQIFIKLETEKDKM